MLAAAGALLAGGYGEQLARSIGIRRPVLLVWTILALGLSAINLPLARGTILVNVGGTVAPAAFAAFLTSQVAGLSARLRVGLVALVCAVPLAAITAWGELTAIGWPAAVAAGCAAAAIAAALSRDARATLASIAAALAFSAGLWALGAARGWLAWPAALGGGASFDAGVVALLSGQVAAWVAASGPGRKPVAGTDSSAP